MSLIITKPAKSIDAIIFDVLDKAVVPKVKEHAKAIAEEERQKIVDKINSNGFNFPTYSEAYAEYKKLNHPGNPFLIASGDYVDSIKVEEVPGGYTIGVGDAVHFGDNQEPLLMRDLARILEFGSPEMNIAPRPHWRPALANLRRRQREKTETARKEATKEANKALQVYLSQPQVRINR